MDQGASFRFGGAERRGVLLVMYDLPAVTAEEKKQYVKFRKELIGRGYRPLQYSVYLKLLRNISDASSEERRVKRMAPENGQVHALSLSAREFMRLHTLHGEPLPVSLMAEDVVVVGEKE